MPHSLPFALKLLHETIGAAVALLCLLVCIATLVAWPRSHWTADSFWWNTNRHVRAVSLSGGHIQLYFQYVAPDAPFQLVADRGHRGRQAVTNSLANVRESGLPTAWAFLGFGYTAGDTGFGFKRVVVIPAWFVASAAALPPLLWLGRFRRHRRRRAEGRRLRKLCVRCGYDLRATPERCPECGTPVSNK